MKSDTNFSTIFFLYGLILLAGYQAGCDRAPQKKAAAIVSVASKSPRETTTVLEEESSPDKESDSHNRQGLDYFKGGNLDAAISEFTQAIDLTPGEARLHNSRGLVYAKKKETDQAIADFSEALRLNPADPQYHNNRAIAYFQKKDYDKSWQDVHAKEKLGKEMNPRFISLLKLASGRDE